MHRAIAATFSPPPPKIVPTAALTDISHTAAYAAWTHDAAGARPRSSARSAR
jgi:hypothetical protein